MKALEVAKYIVNRGIDRNKPISNLQLQKILYFSNIDVIRECDKKLITDGQFEAWDYGPVLREVYNKFSHYGATKLTIREEVEEKLDADVKKIVDKSVDIYIDKSPWELVRKSHQKNSAWYKSYKSGDKNIISNEYIEEEAKNEK